MSDSNSYTTECTDDSEYNFITDYVFEDERQDPQPSDNDMFSVLLLYSDEPLADQEWIREYQQEERERDEKQQELERRLNGEEPIESWYVMSHFLCKILMGPPCLNKVILLLLLRLSVCSVLVQSCRFLSMYVVGLRHGYKLKQLVQFPVSPHHILKLL